MIVFMVLDPSSLIVPVHNICMYIPLCDRQGTIGTIIRYGRGERKKETSLQYCANKNGRNFYAMLPFLSLSFYFLSLRKRTAESIPDYQRSRSRGGKERERGGKVKNQLLEKLKMSNLKSFSVQFKLPN